MNMEPKSGSGSWLMTAALFKKGEKMNDNEMILALQNEVFAAVNRSKMPMAVKYLVLENALMKVNAAMQAEKEQQEAAQTQAAMQESEQAQEAEATAEPAAPAD